MDLATALKETRSERQQIKPIWLCEHVEGQGLFAVIGDTRVHVTIDYRNKIDRRTAEDICDAVGIPWMIWSSHLKKYWLRKCCCGQWFIANHHCKRLCSADCASKAATDRQAKYRSDARLERTVKLESLKCLWCKCDITGVRLSKKFCSAKCRQAGSRRWR